MWYFLNLMSKRYYFGHIGRSNYDVIFSLQEIASAFIETNEE